MAVVINGSGTVTGISVGGLPDGIVDAGTLATNSVDSAELIDGSIDDSHMAAMAASKLTGALPAISGASLTSLPAQGITNRQLWLLTTNLSMTGNSSFVAITANQAEAALTGYARIGSVMTVSSGVFTFPATGIWVVDSIYNFTTSGAGYARGQILVTLNNSSYTAVATSAETLTPENANLSMTAQIDVTDVANVKVKFTQGGTIDTLYGSTSGSASTSFIFTRIGDT